MSSSNIYNILSKLNALQPKAAESKDQVTKPIYESVEARGSIMSGVNRLEKKLSEQFAADKKALDTNPKNAAWDADALDKQKARLSREKKNIGMQRKISGQDTGLPPAMEDAAPVKYGVFSKGGSIGSQRFKDDPLKTFDSKEEAIADAKRRRAGLSKGERGYVVKAIKGVAEGEQGMSRAAKGHEKYGKEGMQALAKAGREGKDLDKVRNQYDKYDEDVTEGWDDMIKAGKARDAETRSGKKSTATGVKHHGKYGTEYQGDADEEDAVAKAADKGPKKRGRPAKGLAKPKPAAGEKKGRGRPKKAADPTYSGAKDLQNYVVGNLPKGKQAKGKVYKMDESRMLDEAGQHLDHILNRFKYEVRNFEETGDLDQDSDLYHALHDYYKETGLLPYDIEKGRGAVSPLTWVADQLEQHLGVSEGSAPMPAAGQPLPGLGQGASHIDATQAAQFKPGSNVLIGGRMPAVVKSVSGTTATVYDPANPAAPFNIETSKLQAAPAAVPDAPAMESELNELAKLAGLTVEAKVKPDYIDLDKDGNKKEPMSQAAQDAEDDDHDYANRLDDEQMDDEQMDENIPVHKHVDGPFDPNSTSDDDEEGDVCPECDGAGCPECYGDEHRDRAHDHARGMERESAIREAQEMINFMRNAGLDTSRAESALAEAYKYGDTDVEEAPEYANSPDEEIQNVDAITRQGDDLNREKKQFAGKPKAGDNPMASESADPLDAMGRRLMQAYESIKVVDEGMVDKVKGMFGKKKDPNAVPNIFDTEPYKSDTKAYLKKSAKQPGGPNNVKNIFDK